MRKPMLTDVWAPEVARAFACRAYGMARAGRTPRSWPGRLGSAGGTGTYDLHDRVTEIQAGSYALMDTAYGSQGLPFRQALTVLARVISVNRQGWAVADLGLKSLGMDHGNPSLPAEVGAVWFCSDEHITYGPTATPRVGDRVRVTPAHVDPSNGYRRYRESQLATARLVAMLRRLEMPLVQVAEVVSADAF